MSQIKSSSLLYYSIIYSQIKYGILSWGTASNLLLKKVKIQLNRILRVITNKLIYTPVRMLYKSLNTLKVIYNLKLGKFMHQLENNKLPLVFFNFSKKINEIHSYKTKLIKKSTYFLPCVIKSFGQLLLSYRGVKLWKSIHLSIKSKHWFSFKKSYKVDLMSKYQCCFVF